MECAHRFGVSAAALRGTVQELASEIDEGISSISLWNTWVADVAACDHYSWINKSNPQSHLVVTTVDKVSGIFGFMCKQS